MGKFSVRYYTLEREHPQGPSLKSCLQTLAEISPNHNRAVTIAGNLTVRLERYVEDGDELAGEFVRVQPDDFPFEVTNDGVAPLQTDGPIGNGIAFRYRPADFCLAIQYDTRILSPIRCLQYLKQQNRSNGFIAKVELDEKAWQRFEDGNVRDFTIKIANPRQIANIEDAGDAVAEAFGTFGKAYDAPYVSIGFGMGHKSGFLSSSVKAVASAFARAEQNGEVDIRSLKAKVKADPDTPAEDINLIDEIFSDSMYLDYPQNDPEENYRIRNNELKKFLDGHR